MDKLFINDTHSELISAQEDAENHLFADLQLRFKTGEELDRSYFDYLLEVCYNTQNRRTAYENDYGYSPEQTLV